MESKRISEKGLMLLKSFEDCRLNAYICPAGVPTIGYGHMLDVRMGDVISKEKAEKLLTKDLKIFENTVNYHVTKPIDQNQFDALVCFAFNIGAGAFKTSTLLRLVNQNPNDIKIADEFKRWVYGVNREKLAGLIERRRKESSLYFENLL